MCRRTGSSCTLGSVNFKPLAALARTHFPEVLASHQAEKDRCARKVWSSGVRALPFEDNYLQGRALQQRRNA